MVPHRDILEGRDSLRKPVAASVALHALVFASLAAYNLTSSARRVLWGDPNSLGGGGSVAITPVSQIPLPPRGGPVNPVANDTESSVPAPPPKPKPEPKREPEPDRDAIAIKGRTSEKKTPSRPVSRQRARAQLPERPNQLYSSSGAAVSSPMFGSTSGSGGVGMGTGSPFGGRYGYYEQILRDRVAKKWRTDDVDPRLQTAPLVIVTFEILRSGSIRNMRFLQRSGYPTLDYSAQRAIAEASPFPPLPAGFERDSAIIEFWFELKR